MPTIDNDSLLIAIREVGHQVSKSYGETFISINNVIAFFASIATLICFFLTIRDFKTVKKAVMSALNINNCQIEKVLHLNTITEAIGFADLTNTEIISSNYGAASVHLQMLNNAVIELIANNTYVDKQLLQSYQARMASDICSLANMSKNPEYNHYTSNILNNVQKVHDELKVVESKQLKISPSDGTK